MHRKLVEDGGASMTLTRPHALHKQVKDWGASMNLTRPHVPHKQVKDSGESNKIERINEGASLDFLSRDPTMPRG